MGRLLKINALKSDYSGQNAILTLFRLERCPMKAWQMQEAKARTQPMATTRMRCRTQLVTMLAVFLQLR